MATTAATSAPADVPKPYDGPADDVQWPYYASNGLWGYAKSDDDGDD